MLNADKIDRLSMPMALSQAELGIAVLGHREALLQAIATLPEQTRAVSTTDATDRQLAIHGVRAATGNKSALLVAQHQLAKLLRELERARLHAASLHTCAFNSPNSLGGLLWPMNDRALATTLCCTMHMILSWVALCFCALPGGFVIVTNSPTSLRSQSKNQQAIIDKRI